MQRGESSKKAFKAIGVSWDKVFKGEKMDKSDWEKLLSIDMKLHYNELKKYIKGIQEYPGCVQMALVSMIYQFGGPGFK